MKNASNDDILNEFQQRRQAFDQLCSRLWDSHSPPYEVFNACTCPVCGYPTLDRRNSYEMCTLCEWEDDGQDDDEADKVWGGPNGDYSLTESRLNFARYGCMYRPGEPDFERVKERQEKNRELIHLFHRMLVTGSSSDLSETVLEVKRFWGMPTNLAEYQESKLLTYRKRTGVISDDRWLGHPVWEGTGLGHRRVTEADVLYHLQLLFERMEDACDCCRECLPGRFDRQPCAACGMPTLEKDVADPCRLCGWPQDDDTVDAQKLSTARVNFAKYLTSLGPNDEPQFSQSQDNALEKCLLIRAYLELGSGGPPNEKLVDAVLVSEQEVFGERKSEDSSVLDGPCLLD